jgi:ribA/ribD-fused uncharacterized protein
MSDQKCDRSAIDKFDDEYRFLSNFYSCRVIYGGIEYPSSEHAFQAAKSIDLSTRLTVRDLPTASQAKRYGRHKIKLRDDWDELKIDIMRHIVFLKFVQNIDLRDKLIQTSPRELIEGNDWGDTFWGTVNGVGENWLGKILMDIRSIFISQKVETCIPTITETSGSGI